MNLNASTMIWGLLFGSIGMGFFVYGKKQSAFMPLISGIVLIAAPYFISNAFMLVALCIVFLMLPFIIKR